MIKEVGVSYKCKFSKSHNLWSTFARVSRGTSFRNDEGRKQRKQWYKRLISRAKI